jgi:tripartite-type tricarboxylate transporter receptor subunit TctC
LTRSGLNRHGRTHKSKKQASGKNNMRSTRSRLNFRQAVWAAVALLTAAAGLSQPSHAADEWPTRDITFYVPYAPGGSTDPISRKYSELLEKQLKVKVIVENKPGASATIGTGAVIRAQPDGYTIGLGSSSSPSSNSTSFRACVSSRCRSPVAAARLRLQPSAAGSTAVPASRRA